MSCWLVSWSDAFNVPSFLDHRILRQTDVTVHLEQGGRVRVKCSVIMDHGNIDIQQQQSVGQTSQLIIKGSMMKRTEIWGESNAVHTDGSLFHISVLVLMVTIMNGGTSNNKTNILFGFLQSVM